VAIAITVGVYGVVALIVKLDDIGLHLAQGTGWTAAFGNRLAHIVPGLLHGLSGIGTAAMLWVGGGILLHGLEELHFFAELPHAVHYLAEQAGHYAGPLAGLVEWLVSALGGALTGLVVGIAVVGIVRQLTTHPEKLIVD
jgi:predicted DNA repair protein MutK